MTPLLKLLRLCDSDAKPALCYVYEGMFRARKRIKDLFKGKKVLYQPYTKIINERWDKMLRTSIHCAAYSLYPTFQYNRKNLCKKGEVWDEVLYMAEKYFSGDELTDLNKALGQFRDSKGNFGRISVVQGRTKHRRGNIISFLFLIVKYINILLLNIFSNHFYIR